MLTSKDIAQVLESGTQFGGVPIGRVVNLALRAHNGASRIMFLLADLEIGQSHVALGIDTDRVLAVRHVHAVVVFVIHARRGTIAVDRLDQVGIIGDAELNLTIVIADLVKNLALTFFTHILVTIKEASNSQRGILALNCILDGSIEADLVLVSRVDMGKLVLVVRLIVAAALPRNRRQVQSRLTSIEVVTVSVHHLTDTVARRATPPPLIIIPRLGQSLRLGTALEGLFKLRKPVGFLLGAICENEEHGHCIYS